MTTTTRSRNGVPVPAAVVPHAPGCPQLSEPETGCDGRSCDLPVSSVVGTATPLRDPSIILGPGHGLMHAAVEVFAARLLDADSRSGHMTPGETHCIYVGVGWEGSDREPYATLRLGEARRLRAMLDEAIAAAEADAETLRVNR